MAHQKGEFRAQKKARNINSAPEIIFYAGRVLLQYQYRAGLVYFFGVAVYFQDIEVFICRARLAFECAVPLVFRVAGTEYFFAPAVIHLKVETGIVYRAYMEHIIQAISRVRGEGIRHKNHRLQVKAYFV